MAAEFAVHQKIPQILVRNNEESSYFYNNLNCMHYLSPETIILESIGAEFVIYQNMIAGI